MSRKGSVEISLVSEYSFKMFFLFEVATSQRYAVSERN